MTDAERLAVYIRQMNADYGGDVANPDISPGVLGRMSLLQFEKLEAMKRRVSAATKR